MRSAANDGEFGDSDVIIYFSKVERLQQAIHQVSEGEQGELWVLDLP